MVYFDPGTPAISKPMINQSMQDFMDKQEILRQKKKDIFEKIIDLQLEITPDMAKVEELNRQLESLRRIENELPTKFEK